ncbi:divergent polysaccharide deacetylase family protein [Rhodobacteraceae bacterium D3-12]|nr:divergent polysaccharide deacetylase family protein [Rhodobacteraceae bacterium D3-12]
MIAVVKGLVSGVVVGVVVSVGAAAGLSVFIGGPTPSNKQPQTAAVSVPAGSEFNKPREDKKASLPASEPVVAEQVAPKVTAPKPDSVAPVATVAKDLGAQPVAGQEPGGMAQPKTGAEVIKPPAPVVASAAKKPLQTTGSSAPKPPSGEAALSISTEPAQPAPPVVEVPKTAFETPKVAQKDGGTQAGGTQAGGEGEVVASVSAPAPKVQSAAPMEPPAPVVTPEASSGSGDVTGQEPPKPAMKPEGKPAAGQVAQAPVAPKPVSAEPVIRVGPPAEPKPVVDPVAEPVVKPEVKPDAVAGAEPAGDPVAPAETFKKTVREQGVKEPAPKVEIAEGGAAPVPTPAVDPKPGSDTPKDKVARAVTEPPAKPVTVPQVKSLPAPPEPEQPRQAQAESAAPPPAIRIGKPAGSFKTVGSKLGTSGGALGTKRSSGLPTIGAGAAAPDGAVKTKGARPIERYAVNFKALENKPKMAIVLIDEGTGSVEIDQLAAFPYPLAIAVDTARDDALDRMAMFRAAGFEVMAMVALPEGATPTDVEVAMPVLMDKVPEAVGVMEAPGEGIQFDRKVSDQVAQILGATGHGLLLYSKGLNTAQKLAAKNGVPSATIFRDFDAAGQNSRTIRRFLNNGALRAGSEGGVVMVGRMRPETVAALLVWGLDERAGQIALAPISALLQEQ